MDTMATRRRFQIADLIEIDAWDLGQTWNGFAVPYLPTDQVEMFCTWINAIMEQEQIADRYVTNDGQIIATDGESSWSTSPATIQTYDGPILAYRVGFGLCWEIMS